MFRVRITSSDSSKLEIFTLPVESEAKISAAYELLGLDKSATEQEIKKAYRKQMNQHHPDKLVAKGLPEEMIDIATQKTQDIKAAYELLKNNRSKV